MQTTFTPERLAESPSLQSVDDILRKCVHCGFCLTTCPTYLITHNELDSPRGRIWLIRDMFQEDTIHAETTFHLDRCTTCEACVTACPAGVEYDRLIDIARAHTNVHRQNKNMELLVWFLTAKWALRIGLLAGRAAQIALPGQQQGLIQSLLPRRLAHLVELLPHTVHTPSALTERSQLLLPYAFQDADATADAATEPAIAGKEKRLAESPSTSANSRGRNRDNQDNRDNRDDAIRGHVLLHTGCVQRQMWPQMNDAAATLLARTGYAVNIDASLECCGALAHHAGVETKAAAHRASCIDRVMNAVDGIGIRKVITASAGCGTHMKRYGTQVTESPADNEEGAEFVAAIVEDVTAFLKPEDLPVIPERRAVAQTIVLAYQSPCSLQHGQGIVDQPLALLKHAGFAVVELPEKKICCGSAGVYNITQPELAADLRARKLAAIDSVTPDAVASANVGCLVQLDRGGKQTPGTGDAPPIAHVVEWLNWACGGDVPQTARTLPQFHQSAGHLLNT
ncbi:MAG: 4Fe-4S dicluster domain-containing protein [Alphaproteobacteria bacterium]|nr:4Fe-4S dicluster domain-containing protein [Alphaproteobacteria bacterium]